jgi:hypothetical protein
MKSSELLRSPSSGALPGKLLVLCFSGDRADASPVAYRNLGSKLVDLQYYPRGVSPINWSCKVGSFGHSESVPFVQAKLRMADC